MATTSFVVTNLNPDFEFPESGFWLSAIGAGGIDPNTDDDGTDDVVIPASGLYSFDPRGVWVWTDGQATVLDGDRAVANTDAALLQGILESKKYAWYPKNPAYDTVSPYLKDGSTSNTNYDKSGNPASVVTTNTTTVTDTIAVVGALGVHFTVVGTVT